MEAYEAKARVWNVDWEGHEIRFELITKTMRYVRTPRTFLFFDGKCVAKSDNCAIKAQVQTDSGNSYLIECETGPKCNCNLQWPSRKSFWGRIDDLLDKLIISNKYIARFAVEGDLIYLSHIGDKDTIERVLIQHELDELAKEERALDQGKKIIYGPSIGYMKEKASKDELEQINDRLGKTRKKLESILSSWKAKREKRLNQNETKNS